MKKSVAYIKKKACTEFEQSQSAFACSKLTVETLGQRVNSVTIV